VLQHHEAISSHDEVRKAKSAWPKGAQRAPFVEGNQDHDGKGVVHKEGVQSPNMLEAPKHQHQ
jgi:hypothetical protein